jgi:hypothetical protein
LLATSEQLLRELFLLDSSLFEENELGYVIDPDDDMGNFVIRPEDGRVDRTPVPFFKSAPFGFGSSDVVLLDRYRIRSSVEQNPLQ